MADLASLLRPDSLEAMVGQSHLIGPEGPLRRLVAAKTPFHAFLFGPPGTGKTTLARIIANMSDRPFFERNATSLKVEELRRIFESHRGSLMPPLLFIDEVHRLSKNQQEVLLPVMERNEAMILGASTENPYFSLTGAIRSRSLLFEFKPLDRAALLKLLLTGVERIGAQLTDAAERYLLDSSGGDARAMLKLLEFAAVAGGDKKPIDVALLKSLRPNALSDGASEDETHYNLASALIKSIRGSDPDAAIYYLARLIHGGEEPRFIARRLLVHASEDIGNANPDALLLAQATYYAVANLGWPEARIPLAQTTIYLACSPKSNSALKAIDGALAAVAAGEILPVPDHLKDAHYSGAKKLGRGVGYQYPHDYGGFVAQAYTTRPVRFVELIEVGFEKRLAEWLDKIRSHTP